MAGGKYTGAEQGEGSRERSAGVCSPLLKEPVGVPDRLLAQARLTPWRCCKPRCQCPSPSIHPMHPCRSLLEYLFPCLGHHVPDAKQKRLHASLPCPLRLTLCAPSRKSSTFRALEGSASQASSRAFRAAR